MKLFKVFASVFLVVILVFITSLFFPHAYRIERSTVVNKPVFETFAYMNDIRNWQDWTPWTTNLDSSMKTFYSPRTAGENARHYFHGNLVGTGRFRITESVPNEKISYDLSINNGALSAKATFYFKAIDGKTQLTWLDSGDVGMNPLYRFMVPSKISSTAEAFEEGLRNIKLAAERH
jgi:hypothetical protein